MKGRFLTVLLGITFCTVSCTEEEKIVLPVPEIIVSDEIDQISLTGEFLSKSQQNVSFEWSTTTAGILLKNSKKQTTSFIIPEGEDEKIVEITLKIRKRDPQKNTQSIVVPGLTTVRSYGLGKEVEAEHTNSVDYSWYSDQQNTGTYSLINCGPTAVTMAIKWANQSFNQTPLDARAMYRSGGGWWYTSDIINYLNVHEINNYTLALNNIDILREDLDNGNIAILCLDMYYVTASNVPQYHYNKFYATNAPEWGHFIVVKGYKEVDGTMFYETYDPYSFGNTYTGGELKGKDRYYTSTDLNLATNLWWDFVIIVSKDASSGRKHSSIDTNLIEHKSGR